MTTATASKPMVAFHGDSKIKAKYLSRVKAHRKADELVKGHYWEGGKGCAVGCTIHGSDHGRYEKELGIPHHLAWLEDAMFEAMTNGDAQAWPERFLSAPQVGADLSLVWPKFAVWMLTDANDGVIRFAKTARTREAIQGVSDLWQRVVNGEQVEDLRQEFRAYAGAAAADAAAAAAYATVACAYAAAADAAAAAACAADAAADAAAAAARAEHWKKMADKLIELMKSAPVLTA